MSPNQCNMTCQCVSGVKRHTFKNGVFYIPLFVIYLLRNFRYPAELLRYPIFPRNYMNHFKHYRFSYSYSIILFLFIPNGTRLCLHYTRCRRLLFPLLHSECNKGNRRRLHAGKIAFASARKPYPIYIASVHT